MSSNEVRQRSGSVHAAKARSTASYSAWTPLKPSMYFRSVMMYGALGKNTSQSTAATASAGVEAPDRSRL
jgi:hypothetical protein